MRGTEADVMLCRRCFCTSSFLHVLHACIALGVAMAQIEFDSPPFATGSRQADHQTTSRQIIKTADLHDARHRKCTPSACDRELLQTQACTSNMRWLDSTDVLNTEQRLPQFAIACSATLPGHWSSPGKGLFGRAGSLPPLGRFSCTGQLGRR